MWQLLYASQMVYPTVIMTAKLSILSLYWRLFPTRFMKQGCIVLAVLTVMWWIAGVLVDIFQCSPVKKAFEPPMTPDRCIDQNAYCLASKQFPYTITNPSRISTTYGLFLKDLFKTANLEIGRAVADNAPHPR